MSGKRKRSNFRKRGGRDFARQASSNRINQDVEQVMGEGSLLFQMAQRLGLTPR